MKAIRFMWGFVRTDRHFGISILLVVSLVGLLAAPAPHVQAVSPMPQDWVPLSTPQAPGGEVTALALAPSDPNVLYSLIAADAGNRFFRSLDGGMSWQESYFFPDDGQHIYAHLAVDPAHPLTLYASGQSGLLRSQDGGDSWDKIYPLGEAFTIVSPQLMYASGANESCGPAPGENYRLARSEDGGNTWQSFDSIRCVFGVDQIAASAARPGVVYVSVDIPYGQGALLKSTDSGETWMAFTQPYAWARSALLIDPTDPDNLYAAGLYGIRKSADAGETWQVISSQSMGIYQRLAFSGGSLYAVEATVGQSPVYRSDDGGASWWISMTLLPAGATGLQADPTQAGRLWAGLLKYGIYRTENGGSAWSARNDGILTPACISQLAIASGHPDILYAAADLPYAAIFRSEDGGQTWSAPLPGLADFAIRTISDSCPYTPLETTSPGLWIPPLEIGKLLIHPVDPEIAWAATSKGIYETLDGANWSLVSSSAAVDLTVSPLAPDEPYAVWTSAQNQIYIAHRQCVPSWSCHWSTRQMTSAALTVEVLRVDPSDPQRLIAGGSIYSANQRVIGIFLSLDGGMSWGQIGMIDLNQSLLNDLVFSPINPQRVVASVTLFYFPMLWLSQDGGSTWQMIEYSNDLYYYLGWPVVLDGLGTVYIGRENGVFYQNLVEDTWESFGLTGEIIRELAYQPGAAPFLLAAGDQGLWRLDLPPIRSTWLPSVAR